MEYSEGRQHSLNNIKKEDVELVFQVIADYFNIKWLKSHRDHPIQKLWNRKDPLATHELFTFGICLKRMASIDPKWVKKLVHKIKVEDANSRLGALFEIIGLGIISNIEQRVIPTKGNNPGFDGILELSEGRQMRISLKNYGISSRNKNFLSKSQEFTDHLKKLLKEKKIISVHLLISTERNYPEDKDWHDLFSHISSILDSFIANKSPIFVINDFWIVGFANINNSPEHFHSDYNSYSLIIAVPFYANEEKNLFDKLDEACYNLVEHSKIETDKIINVVEIHLPVSASIIKCKEWVESYFSQYPTKPITGVILYQPACTNNLNEGTNFINHCFQFILRNDKIKNWLNTDIIKVEIPVGRISNEPHQDLLVLEDPDGIRHQFPLTGKYSFQKGEYYTKMIKDEKGNLGGNIKRISSGIFTYPVIEPFPGQGSVVIGGHFPPNDELLIL